MSNAVIGQDQLLNRINKLTVDNFPHSLLIVGSPGSGKHLISSYIADKLGLETVVIDSKITPETMEEMLIRPYPALYVVELDEMLPKVQGSLLKVIEEPSAGVFIAALSSNTKLVIPTLLNRCMIFNLKPYKDEDLRKFIKVGDEDTINLILEIFRTPGKILEAQSHPLLDMRKLAVDVLNRASTVSYPNLLTISDKIAFKDEKDKFNLDIFVDVLNAEALRRVKDNGSEADFKRFLLISKLKSKLDMSIFKQRVLEGFLIDLKGIANDVA